MLEDAVKSDKSNPSDVASRLLQFIQFELPVGGQAAEQRFFHLYRPICERIFGRILDSKENYKHAEGGWLSSLPAPSYRQSSTGSLGSTGNGVGMTRSSSGLSTSSGGPTHGSGLGVRTTNLPSSSSMSSLENDPVVKLLATASPSNNKNEYQPNLIDVISTESVNRAGIGFPLPFQAFPDNMRESWLALLEASLGGNATPLPEKCSPNTARLLNGLLRRGPLEQVELLAYKQSQAQEKEATAPLMQLSPRGFHPTSPVASMASSAEKDKKPSEPSVIFGMLEYYLFLFFRFPMKPPVRKTSSATATSSSGFSSHGVNRHRISVNRSGSARRVTESYSETVYKYLFGRYLKHFLPYEQLDVPSLSHESELFVRILVALWLESVGQPKGTLSAVERHFRRHPPPLNLHLSYDLAEAKYDPPYRQVQKCLLATVKHLIMDASLEVRDRATYKLTNALSILQEPFYNYIRISFRHASIHVAESPFYSALEAWLVWLEPWNVEATRQPLKNIPAQRMIRSSGSHPMRYLASVKYDSPSKYSPKWEAYVAANLHLYTVPLAIFLRRSRELDFSSSNFERSLQIVRRVFRVYSPSLIDCVNRLLQRTSPDLLHLVDRHSSHLGLHAPPNTETLSLSSCQEDMTILLEEIHSQYSKKHGGKSFDTYVNKVLGQSIMPGAEKSIKTVLQRARLMVQLPEDYQVEAKPVPTRAAIESRPSLYGPDGVLTEEGYHLIMTGQAKCNPLDAVFVGDELNRRVGTEESELLVEFFVYASHVLSEKTGWKWNLRFLADRQTFATTCLGLFLFFVFLWGFLFW